MREYLCSSTGYQPDLEALLQLLHTEADSRLAARARKLLAEAEGIIRPCFLLRELPVGRDQSGLAVVNGVVITSQVVARRIGSQASLLAYVISCGPEIAAFGNCRSDLLDRYILDQIAYLGYLQAKAALLDYVEQELLISRYNLLSPGSIVDWSVAEAVKIFELLDGAYQQLKIRVLESGMIDPLKSTSGLLVANEEEFHSCQLCQILRCPDRAAPFDEAQYLEMLNQ